MVERAAEVTILASFFFPGAVGFMKMHTETDRCSSYLMLVTHEKQSDFWRFLSNDPIGWKILSEYVVFPRSALGYRAICSSTMAAIAASSVSIAPTRVAAARQSRSRARAAVVVKASADERQVRDRPL